MAGAIACTCSTPEARWDAVSRCTISRSQSSQRDAAGRLKDYELIAALVQRGLVDPSVVRERIDGFEEARLRAVLLARMQIVEESLRG
jgi:hypothetical protein